MESVGVRQFLLVRRVADGSWPPTFSLLGLRVFWELNTRHPLFLAVQLSGLGSLIENRNQQTSQVMACLTRAIAVLVVLRYPCQMPTYHRMSTAAGLQQDSLECPVMRMCTGIARASEFRTVVDSVRSCPQALIRPLRPVSASAGSVRTAWIVKRRVRERLHAAEFLSLEART